MDDTRAGHYYRRLGFDGLIVRGSPGVRRGRNLVRVREHDLAEGMEAEWTVHPELILRSKEWKFFGKVVRFWEGSVVFRVLAGEQTGTIIRIPYRYFEDGRVWKKVLNNDGEFVDNEGMV